MRISKVTDVDVIAHAGAIRCGIVVAKNSDVIDFVLCRLQDEWDEVSFGMVAFTSIDTGAGSIEITQSNKLQLIAVVVVSHDALDEELGPSIRIGWLLRVCFVDRNMLRLTVGRAR